MTKRYGIDLFTDQLAAALSADLVAAYEGNVPRMDSPLEALFLVALTATLKAHPDYEHVSYGGLLDPYANALDYDVHIGRQLRVIDWPVDFVITATREDRLKIRRLAVECDGHEFHERTKEQAARDRSRDRALQAAGFTVMRFTGSELYRDPMKCVREVLDWCLVGYWETGS